MDLREVFAANLRRFRHEKGLSQEELAFKARVNRTYVSKLETGATYVGLEITARIANVLGIEALELLRPPPRRSKRQR
jgi:transcriptional regulator with XRE-family HTH domain